MALVLTYDIEDAVDDVDGGSVVRLRVKPDADSTEVRGFDEWRGRVEVAVEEPAEDGRANRELLQLLSRTVDADVTLRSGERSREKSIEAAAGAREVLDELGLG